MKKMLMAMMVMPIMAMALEVNPSFSSDAVIKYKIKANAGDAEAQYLYAKALMVGLGVTKNLPMAMEQARESATKGYGLSYRIVGLGYANGWGVSSNLVEAAKWHSKCFKWAQHEAERGDVWAQFYLGVYYEEGGCNGCIEKNVRMAAKWYRKAAEQGHVQSQVQLGLCYCNGNGVPMDTKIAVKWWKMAAKQDNVDAQYNLGLAYWNGMGVEKNLDEASRWWWTAAEGGDALSQYNLGLCYHEGMGAERDAEEAVRWFRKAAEKGVVLAQVKLGDLYLKGDGIEKDGEEAIRWYQKAAEQGDVNAQYLLAMCYDEGKGVEKYPEMAARWYRKAMEQGHSNAKENLTRLARKNGIAIDCLLRRMELLDEVATNGQEKEILLQKASKMKYRTFVFKGLYLGMDMKSAYQLLHEHLGLFEFNAVDVSNGRVKEFIFNREIIDKIFKTSGMLGANFCKSICSAYPIVEKFDTKYEEIADVKRQKEYVEKVGRQAAINGVSYARDPNFARYLINKTDQMKKTVPYYCFKSNKGFVLEIHPDRPEIFFVLRSIALMNASDSD